MSDAPHTISRLGNTLQMWPYNDRYTLQINWADGYKEILTNGLPNQWEPVACTS